MSYVRLNKTDGDIFNASDVTHIEDGIIQNESDISLLNDSSSENTTAIAELETSLSNLNSALANLTEMKYTTFSTSESVQTQIEELPDSTIAFALFPYQSSGAPSSDQGYLAIIFKQDNDFISILAFSTEESYNGELYMQTKAWGIWGSWATIS